MGLIYAEMRISNPAKENLETINVKALVDTGSLYLCIPAHIAIQLQLKEYEKREVTITNGTKHLCAYVGPIRLQVANRQCLTGALVLGEEVLLGAIPIEDMDMLIHPAQLKLIVNPENPNIPGAIVK